MTSFKLWLSILTSIVILYSSASNAVYLNQRDPKSLTYDKIEVYLLTTPSFPGDVRCSNQEHRLQILVLEHVAFATRLDIVPTPAIGDFKNYGLCVYAKYGKWDGSSMPVYFNPDCVIQFEGVENDEIILSSACTVKPS